MRVRLEHNGDGLVVLEGLAALELVVRMLKVPIRDEHEEHSAAAHTSEHVPDGSGVLCHVEPDLDTKAQLELGAG